MCQIPNIDENLLSYLCVEEVAFLWFWKHLQFSKLLLHGRGYAFPLWFQYTS